VALEDESRHFRNFFLNHSHSEHEKSIHRGDDDEEDDEVTILFNVSFFATD
jgi:hypothetical protein